MPAEPHRLRRPAPVAAASSAPRHWLSQALAGLVISGLGLGIAGSITTPSRAEPPASLPNSGTLVPGVAPRTGATATPDPAAVEPFTPAGSQPEPLRQAIVAERAAQRAEELAKAAEEVTRTARTASGKARQEQLSADEKATRAEGARLAKEALDRAVAARIAAARARAQAEAAAGQAIELDHQAPAQPPAPPRAPAAPPAAPAGPPSGGNRPAASPVPNAVIGAHFGEYGLWSRYHTGLDFRAAYGVPIRAVKSGTVIYAGNSGDWSGNHVAVRHGDGMTTMSSHMSRMSVRAGQSVQAGQIIGYVGQTGRAFGPHLHFELYPRGVVYGDVYRAINPLPWLRSAGVRTG